MKNSSTKEPQGIIFHNTQPNLKGTILEWLIGGTFSLVGWSESNATHIGAIKDITTLSIYIGLCIAVLAAADTTRLIIDEPEH